MGVLSFLISLFYECECRYNTFVIIERFYFKVYRAVYVGKPVTADRGLEMAGTSLECNRTK